MAAQFYIEQISHNNVNGFEVYTTLRPDRLESTILKITGKISAVIYSLLSLDNSLLCRKIVNFLLTNN